MNQVRHVSYKGRSMEVQSDSELRRLSRLLDRRDRLEDLLEGLRKAATSRDDYEPHDITDDEAAIQADAVQLRLTATVIALDRIESGVYGLCLACESPIAETRLQALPTAALCRKCVK